MPGTTVMPPPILVLDDAREARVDPRPVVATDALVPDSCCECTAPSVAFGPICATVEDDRMRLHASGSPWWVGVRIDGLRWAGLVGPDKPATVRPLPVDAALSVAGHALDARGTGHEWRFEGRTQVVRDHLVLNEVMANPVGPEPEQEWVELYNDGAGAVQLEGWSLEDSGGLTKLPECLLQPGQFALVVSPSFDPQSWVDRPPAAGARILRVEKLGTDGISNAGEPLRIVSKTGQTASSIPPIASPRAGESIARLAVDLPDSEAGSFASGTDGGTPGASNSD